MRPSFITLAFVLGFCFLALVGYGTWYSLVAQKSSAVATLEKQIVAKTKTGARIASARASLAEIADNESKVQGYFVSEDAVVDFINYLEARGVAQETVVKVLSVSAGDTTLVTPKGNQSKRPTLALTLSVQGPFAAVMRTVGAIEYAPYDLVISHLSVVNGDDTNWHADIKLVVGSTAASSTPATQNKTP